MSRMIVMSARIASVPFSVNFAKDYVSVAIIFMPYKLGQCISAGLSFLAQVQEKLSICLIFRQEHSCSALCAAEGICQIEHAPQSVEATFTGRHETFQYTKVK